MDRPHLTTLAKRPGMTADPGGPRSGAIKGKAHQRWAFQTIVCPRGEARADKSHG